MMPEDPQQKNFSERPGAIKPKNLGAPGFNFIKLSQAKAPNSAATQISNGPL